MSFMNRITQVWIDHFQLAPQPRTILKVNEVRGEEVVFWPVGEQVVVEFAPAKLEAMQQIMTQFPSDHRLTVDDLRTAWGEVETGATKMYALDAASFRPFTPEARFTIRPLTQADEVAYAEFQSQTTEAEREEGDVTLDQMSPFGALDGTRIVAAASAYEWRGFIDIGVIVDPAYRKMGLGKAVVSACSAHFLPGDKIVVYRHDVNNLGSQGIALGVNYTYYSTIESVEKKIVTHE